MAFAHSQNAGLFFQEFNLSGYTRQLELMAAIAEHDTTVLGEAAERVSLGLKSGGIRFQGLLDSGAGASYGIVSAAFAAATPKVITVFPEQTTIGKPAMLCYAWETELGLPVDVNEYNALTAYLNASEDGLDFGNWLHPLQAISTTGSLGSHDSGAGSANGGVGHLHVMSAAGGSPAATIKIQHSSDNSTWVDLVTFTQANGPTSQRVEVAPGTTVNRYLRVFFTLLGSSPVFTFAVAFARR